MIRLVFLAAVDQRSFFGSGGKIYIHVGTITLEDLVGAVDIAREKSQRTGNQLQYLMLQIAQLVIKGDRHLGNTPGGQFFDDPG